MTGNTVTENEVKSLIIDLFKKELKTNDISDSSNFLDFGGDSLGIMTVISAAEEKFNVELNPREVLLHPTPEKIAALVLASQTKSPEEEPELSEVDLRKEAVLPDDIKPCGNYETDESSCKNIFLTGATGFLGAFLVRDLLNKNGETTIYCLVRCVNKYDGLDRIKSNMIAYNCWKDSFRHRIIAVKGDLSKKHFGVSDEEWNDLSEKTDMVFHCGAVLNFLYPYSAMKKTNVSSTVEALRLSVNKKMKYFNYISSYSVYDNPSHFGKNALENDELESPDGYFLGYSETKWVSEKLVRAAQEKGVRAKIYRPGDITGTKEDGIWAVRDLTSRMIIGCIQMKAVPIVEMPLNFTPVDYVSAAIVHIAFMSTNRNKAFNIINPHIGSSTELLKAIYRSKKVVVPVPYPLWKQVLKKSRLAKNALKILSCMFDDSGEGDIITRHMEKQPIYDMFNTRTALEGTGIECPPMDADLLEAYISYFKKAKLI